MYVRTNQIIIEYPDSRDYQPNQLKIYHYEGKLKGKKKNSLV